MTVYYVDQDSGDNGNGGTGTGDAWLTLDYAFTQWANYDKINITGTGTYTATLDPGNGGTIHGTVAGYTSTGGDGGSATLKLGASVNLFAWGTDSFHMENLILDGDGYTGRAISQTANNSFLRNVEFTGFAGGSVFWGRGYGTGAYFHDNTVTGSILDGQGGFFHWTNVFAFDNPNCNRIFSIGNSGGSISNFIFHNNGGTGADSGTGGMLLADGIIDGQAGSGIQQVASGVWSPCIFRNLILSNNGVYGLNNSNPASSAQPRFLENVYGYNNTSGNVDDPDAYSGSVINLTEDPYVNRAINDFNINDTADGGAVLRAISSNILTNTSEHPFYSRVSDSFGGGGGGGLLTHTGMSGGMRG